MTTDSQAAGRDLAYCRISLDTSRSGSIAKQRERLEAAVKAADRDPSRIVWHVDEGVSGSRDVKRPGRDALMGDVRKGDRVLVTKIDRLARNVDDLRNIVAHINDVGASIRFVDNDIDTASASGRLILTILGAIAEFEAQLIGERRRESMQTFINEGRHAVGKPPFGFMAVENPNGRGLVIVRDPETAPILRTALEMVLDGKPQSRARRLTGHTASGFGDLLRNPRLAGMTRRPSGEIVTVNGVPRVDADAAILTLPEWDRLQKILDKPARKSWSKGVGFGRALECDICGSRLYVNRKAKYSTYVCRTGTTPDDPGQRHGLGIRFEATNEFVESQFLEMWGDEPHSTVVVVEDDTARSEAVAAANIRAAEINRRMSATSDPETLVSLAAELVEANKARIAAEAIPASRREVVRESDRTIREVWEDAEDDLEREELISALGSFVVHKGLTNLGPKGQPVSERIEWRGLTPDRVFVNGERGRVVLVDAPAAPQPSLFAAMPSRVVPAGLRAEVRPL